MPAILMIRRFEQPVTADDMHRAAEAGKWCLGIYGASPRLHFISGDGLRCACVFEAPDAEALRNVLRVSGLKTPEALWAASFHPGLGDSTSPFAAPKASGTIAIVEREFPGPIAFEDVQAQEDRAIACFQLHKARFLRSYFSLARQHMICLYEAPDAESVRIANRQAELPARRVWPAQVVVA